MRLLALDTTTARASAAVVDDDRTLGTWVGDPARSHADQLPSGLLHLLEQTDGRTPFSAVDAFAVAVGPGSFTGLRIGIATIQGLAFATRRPVVPVSVLEALAHVAAADRARSAALVAAWIDAHRREVYSALYRRAPAGAGVAEVDPPAVGDPAATVARWRAAGHEPDVFIGDGAELYARMVPPAARVIPGLPLAETIGRLALQRAHRGASLNPAAIQPLYVRRPDAEIARDAPVAG